MQKKGLFWVILPIVLLVINGGFVWYQSVQQLQTHLTIRQLHNNVTTRIEADIFFGANGSKMLSHFTYPQEYFISTNNKGEFKAYDPTNNTLISEQNFALSSDINLFAYFFRHKTADLGLQELGFGLISADAEETYIIQNWKAIHVDNPVQRVELVHENDAPIFMAYYDINETCLRKVFFDVYKKVGNFTLPSNITEINYLAPNDSMIQKTVYSNFLINDAVDSKMLNYQIPANAKLLK
ncbi:MAG: hypothetical protein R2798_05370 [Chitinophagales bacterium]|nr:hypothetical protein [Bacteroidota bacterium]MCB9042652.1 hypothetical protein [Chitinophagales bacterium]